jgi:(2R)-3-sulfolactate dehydrogenase (NADP+)
MARHLTLEDATDLAARALTASGALTGPAQSVARAVVTAEARGRSNVGFRHLLYYCDALRRGAVDGRAEPVIEPTRPAWLTADARSGFAHYAFDRALDTFVDMTRASGVAVLSVRNTYTSGELGYFPDRLADHGLIALAATNAGPAAVAPAGADRAVFSTNPIAFAFPRADGPPLLVDQSSSACTLVDVHAARERGESIPGDWALDRDGRPTTNPDEALHGAFRPFGGYKGSNIALLVELLTAGLGGGNWSVDAPSFAEGDACPDVGQWFLAMDPDAAGKAGTSNRINSYIDRIAGFGAHMPGRTRAERRFDAARDGITIEAGLYEKVQKYCEPG